MGIVTNGVPAEIVLELARMANATVFVETGTCHGATARWAAEHFTAVYTVERSVELYTRHEKWLRELKGVTPLLGDSREKLPAIVAGLGARTAVHWLDGHWSGGNTAGEGDECPLLAELACLAGRRQDIILIDDARLFLSSPPRPYQCEQWPGIADIIDALGPAETRPCIQIIEDVIFAVPNSASMRSRLQHFAQDRSDSFWNSYVSLLRGEALPANDLPTPAHSSAAGESAGLHAGSMLWRVLRQALRRRTQ